MTPDMDGKVKITGGDYVKLQHAIDWVLAKPTKARVRKGLKIASELLKVQLTTWAELMALLKPQTPPPPPAPKEIELLRIQRPKPEPNPGNSGTPKGAK